MAAGGGVIGALRVVLGADTAAFEKGLKGASKGITATAKDMAKMGAALAAAFVPIAAFVKGAVNAADAMLEASQRAGVAFGAFQQLDYAASLAGVSTQQLESAMGMLSKRMGETAANSKSALGKIGIAVRDSNGQMRDSVSVLEEIADRYVAAGSSAERARILTESFGRSGMQLAPMLAGGSAGLRELREEAERLGLVLSDDLGAKADNLNDQMATFAKVIRANFQHGILQGFLGDAKDLRAVFTDPAFAKGIRDAGIALGTFASFAVRNSREIIAVSAGIATMFLATRVGAKGVISIIGGLGTALGAYIAMGQAGAGATFELSDALKQARDAFSDTGGIVDEQKNKIKLSTEELNRSAEQWAKLTDALYLGEEAHRRMKDAIDLANEARATGAEAGTELGEKWMAAAIAAQRAQYQYEEVAQQMERMRDVGEQVGASISSAFEDAIFKGGEFKDVLRGLAQDLARLAFRETVGNPLMKAFGAIFSGAPLTAAEGARIRGPGTGKSDSIPAMLSNGEFVVNARAAKKWGGLLQAINADAFAGLKFAAGGFANVAPSPDGGRLVGFGERLR